MPTILNPIRKKGRPVRRDPDESRPARQRRRRAVPIDVHEAVLQELAFATNERDRIQQQWLNAVGKNSGVLRLQMDTERLKKQTTIIRLIATGKPLEAVAELLDPLVIPLIFNLDVRISDQAQTTAAMVSAAAATAGAVESSGK